MTHGGKRPGAGRPALENPKKPFPLRVTAEESEKLKQYLIELRKHD